MALGARITEATHSRTRRCDNSQLLRNPACYAAFSCNLSLGSQGHRLLVYTVILERTSANEVLAVFPLGEFELEEAVKVSAPIREDFREAGLCLGAGCFKASMVMSRRVLQRCLKEQGCTQRKLIDAIDHAIKKGVLRVAFHDIAQEIREYGNLGAHPDDGQLRNATRESAEQILKFGRLLIHDFYEIPAQVARLKQNRHDATSQGAG